MKFGISAGDFFAMFGKKLGYNSVGQIKREVKRNGKKRISSLIRRNRKFVSELRQDELARAIDMAKNADCPDRALLYEIYEQIADDAHLLSQIRTNVLKVTGSPFAVFVEGTDTIDEAATKLLMRPWFESYRGHFHRTPFWGHTLIEFQRMVPAVGQNPALAYEFKKVKVFPREHVRPETGEIVVHPGDAKGIPYRDNEWGEWFVEMGDDDDLGLYRICAKEAIWKNYSRADWSRMSEKYGMPILAIKASTDDEKELDKIEQQAESFGSNMYVILDEADSFEIKESSKSDGYKIYEDKARYCDEQISKIISGQTGTSDEKSFVGSAEVHERILDDYVEYSMRSETYHNNFELFPFLARHGYPLQGREFRYLEIGKNGTKKDGDDGPGKIGDANANFTKPPVAVAVGGGTLTGRVNAFYNAGHNGCRATIEARDDDDDFKPIGKAADKAADRVYKKQLEAGQVDKGLWRAVADEFANASIDGYGKRLAGVKYGSPDHVMLFNLRHNAQVFAAFKNHHNVNELVKALVDGQGNIRSEAAFKKAAGLTKKKYNKNWARTERKQALLTGRNAQRWQRIESRRDVFPRVEYVAVMDSRTTNICKDLHGGIWEIDDPILNTIAPGNHWGCRSLFRSTDKPANRKQSGEEVQEGFRNNPGKSGMAFSKEHPYFKVQKQYEKDASNFFGLLADMAIDGKSLLRNAKLLAGVDPNAYDISANNLSGGFFAVLKNLGDKNGLTDTARKAAATGQAVEVRGDGQGQYNAIVDGSPRLVTAALSVSELPAVFGQGRERLLVHVVDTAGIADIARALKDNIKASSVQSVWVLYKGRLVKLGRDEILKTDISEKLK